MIFILHPNSPSAASSRICTAIVTHLLQHHHKCPCADQNAADQGLGGKRLVQEGKGQRQSDNHAQLVNGYRFGRFTLYANNRRKARWKKPSR